MEQDCNLIKPRALRRDTCKLQKNVMNSCLAKALDPNKLLDCKETRPNRTSSGRKSSIARSVSSVVAHPNCYSFYSSQWCPLKQLKVNYTLVMFYKQSCKRSLTLKRAVCHLSSYDMLINISCSRRRDWDAPRCSPRYHDYSCFGHYRSRQRWVVSNESYETLSICAVKYNPTSC